MVLVSEEKRLITGAADSELRAWDIAYLQEVMTVSDHGQLHVFTVCHLINVESDEIEGILTSMT